MMTTTTDHDDDYNDNTDHGDATAYKDFDDNGQLES